VLCTGERRKSLNGQQQVAAGFRGWTKLVKERTRLRCPPIDIALFDIRVRLAVKEGAAGHHVVGRDGV
jgi:hypothetical protein